MTMNYKSMVMYAWEGIRKQVEQRMYYYLDNRINFKMRVIEKNEGNLWSVMVNIKKRGYKGVIMLAQQTRMDWNKLKWIQIFRNIDSRMLKWMLFNLNAFLFIYGNCMEHISMPFNLKIILAFSVHIVKTVQFTVQNFE